MLLGLVPTKAETPAAAWLVPHYLAPHHLAVAVLYAVKAMEHRMAHAADPTEAAA